jgi:CheY-like chemotaxis protein
MQPNEPANRPFHGVSPGDVLSELTSHAVHHALVNLYANIELAASPLIACFPQTSSETGMVERAQALRALLLEAIQSLRPLRSAPPLLGAERSYEVLSLRYVAGLSVDRIAERLALTERQIYRDLRRAEDNLVEVLRMQQTAEAAPAAASLPPDELDALSAQEQTVDLDSALRSAVLLVRPLAARQAISLQVAGSPRPVWVHTVPGVLRQVLVQILSALVQQTPPAQTLTVRLAEHAGQTTVHLPLVTPYPAESDALLAEALAISQRFGITVREPEGAAPPELQLALTTARVRPVLIVEDNEAAHRLYQRYLEGTAWQPVSVPEPSQVEKLAAELQPAAILLDLLMPNIDGWSLLQALKLNPDTSAIPVLLCSVVHDPELAVALGATAALKKPLSRLDLLDALAQMAATDNRAGPAASPVESG